MFICVALAALFGLKSLPQPQVLGAVLSAHGPEHVSVEVCTVFASMTQYDSLMGRIEKTTGRCNVFRLSKAWKLVVNTSVTTLVQAHVHLRPFHPTSLP